MAQRLFSLSIPFRIPGMGKIWGVLGLLDMTFNSFPDSSWGRISWSWWRGLLNLSIPFRIPAANTSEGWGRKNNRLSIPFRIPVTQVKRSGIGWVYELSIPFRIPELEITATVPEEGTRVENSFNSFPDSRTAGTNGTLRLDYINLSIPFRIPAGRGEWAEPVSGAFQFLSGFQLCITHSSVPEGLISLSIPFRIPELVLYGMVRKLRWVLSIPFRIPDADLVEKLKNAFGPFNSFPDSRGV